MLDSRHMSPDIERFVERIKLNKRNVEAIQEHADGIATLVFMTMCFKYSAQDANSDSLVAVTNS